MGNCECSGCVYECFPHTCLRKKETYREVVLVLLNPPSRVSWLCCVVFCCVAKQNTEFWTPNVSVVLRCTGVHSQRGRKKPQAEPFRFRIQTSTGTRSDYVSMSGMHRGTAISRFLWCVCNCIVTAQCIATAAIVVDKRQFFGSGRTINDNLKTLTKNVMHLSILKWNSKFFFNLKKNIYLIEPLKW